ncbi:hypothetical protein GCM10009087_49150 [Sphingomonas oligophenolica]
MSRNLFALLTAVAVVTSTPAFAKDDAPSAPAGSAAVVAKSGQVIRDVNGRRIGVVDTVRGDKVFIITATKMVSVPTSTLSLGSGGLQTSLKSSDVH